MKINPHTVQNLVNIIVNDGNGSQCGMTYAERCVVSSEKQAADLYRAACGIASKWIAARGGEKANALELRKAAGDVADYYANHLKEN